MSNIKKIHDSLSEIMNLSTENKGILKFKFKDGTTKLLRVKNANFNTDFLDDTATATIETFENDISVTKVYNLSEIEKVSF